MRTMMRWALAPACVMALAGCGEGADKADGAAGAAAPSNRTVAATLKDDRSFGVLERVLDNAALGEVLAGRGPYTVFAPSDAAFAASTGGDLGDEAMKAQGAALLRAHIVPGALTRADILAAIARNGSGAAEMRTMANSLLTFSKEGETVVVTGENGARARLTGAETVASNGVVQPVDALLVRPSAPAAPAAG